MRFKLDSPHWQGDKRWDGEVVSLDAVESALEVARSALLAAKRSHLHVEDCWYSCPKSEDGCCDEEAGDACNCGADKHNAAIDEALAQLALQLAVTAEEAKA